jgi:hypothetical protein
MVKKMEIYTLKISFAQSNPDFPWSRTIEVPEDFTFLKLHNYIQEIIEFDNDHLFEFFSGKSPRNKLYTISNNSKLNEIFPLDGLKLYYLFDFGDNWLFKIIKTRKKHFIKPETTIPRVVKSVGKNPEQYGEWEE